MHIQSYSPKKDYSSSSVELISSVIEIIVSIDSKKEWDLVFKDEQVLYDHICDAFFKLQSGKEILKSQPMILLKAS